MLKNMEGKSVVIIGATGGLGAAFSRAFAEKGARLMLAGRNEDKLNNVKTGLNGDVKVAVSNLTDSRSLEELSEKIMAWSPEVDLIINASGFDVRKSLEDHSYDEIEKLIEINLLGTILITKTLLRNLKDEKGSTIIHIGGFGDGRLAFPYYSVDVATRAGVFSFIESVNRELEMEGRNIRVTYFSPSPTETEAERPFHNLWRKMGIRIVPVERVAEELIRTYEKKANLRIKEGNHKNICQVKFGNAQVGGFDRHEKIWKHDQGISVRQPLIANWRDGTTSSSICWKASTDRMTEPQAAGWLLSAN